MLNCGRVVASDCMGFWTIFDPSLREISSGRGVFWSPVVDNDYDFLNRESTAAAIEFNERRYCWAELDVINVPVEGTGTHLFPYECPEGLYTFALVIEYGQYKSFDFLGMAVLERISSSIKVKDAIDKLKLNWNLRRGVRGFVRYKRLNKFIAKMDYQNYIRPT